MQTPVKGDVVPSVPLSVLPLLSALQGRRSSGCSTPFCPKSDLCLPQHNSAIGIYQPSSLYWIENSGGVSQHSIRTSLILMKMKHIHWLLVEKSSWHWPIRWAAVHDAFVYFFQKLTFSHTSCSSLWFFFNVSQEMYNMLMSNTDYSTQTFCLAWFLFLENPFVLILWTIYRYS